MKKHSWKVSGVDSHADVGRVLPRVGAAGDLDQLDGCFMELPFVIGEAVPVAVGLLEDDLPLFQETLEEELDFEFLVFSVPDADGDVLKIHEQGDFAFGAEVAGRGRREILHRVAVKDGTFVGHILSRGSVLLKGLSQN